MTTVIEIRSMRSGCRTVVLVAAISLSAMSMAACSDGEETAPTTTAAVPATTSVASTDVATTGVTTGVTTSVTTTAPEVTTTPPPATAAPTTDVPAGSSTVPASSTSSTSPLVCPSIGGRDGVQSDFPGGLTSLVGVDIRTGAHECFERIVIEFAPGDAPTPGIPPGYWVRYTEDPVTLGQTDDQFVTIRGEATVLATVEAWMYDVDAAGEPTDYAGAIDLFPANVSWIEELRLIDNSEGVQVWAIGLDRERDLRVSVLRDPQRLVIDIGA